VADSLPIDCDLASRWLGSSVMAASDESFGDKENLLKPEAPVFEPGRYDNRGEIVDGWETRRRREPGHDWALVRLGAPGVITSIDVDTSFFTGNYPEAFRVEACGREGYPSPAQLADPDCEWIEVVPRSPLRGNAHNTVPVSDARRFTHVRLSVFPDGGVARLRVRGQVIPDPRRFDGLTLDLASQEHGGAVVASSDSFYTSAQLLIRPDRARTMGEGWETRRRRDAGHDFVVIRLAFVGTVRQLIVDTAHFKYNATAEIEVQGCADRPAPSVESPAWSPLLGRTRLQPDTRHVFPVAHPAPVGSIRLDAFPDGGLSRVRVIGTIDPAARRWAGYRWFNALPTAQAMTCLIDAGVARGFATDLVHQRPLRVDWVAGRQDQASLRPLKAMLEG
jgi:allantoicase